jgi:cytochrome P450
MQDGKSAAEDEILPNGFKVKKGDGITYMAYVMGRMKNIWGDDAEEFHPERWLHDGIFQPESPSKFTAVHVSNIKPISLLVLQFLDASNLPFLSVTILRLALAFAQGRNLLTGK